MKRGFRTRSGWILASLVIPVLATAHTNLFYPGDAYFVSALHRDGFDRKTEDTGGIRFGYSPLYNARMPCGTAGYQNLDIRDPEGKLRANLKIASDLLWKTFSPDAEDWGGLAEDDEEHFYLFVYNRDFDLLGDAIAIKYNEQSEEIQERFGVRHAISNRFDEAAWMTVREVMKENKVPGLRLARPAPEIPESESADKSKRILRTIDEPVGVDASQVQVVIPVGGEFDIVHFAEKKTGLTLLIVTESGVARYESDRDEEWLPIPLDAPRNDYIDKIREGEETAYLVSAAVKLFVHRHGWEDFYQHRLEALVKKPEKEINHPELWTPLLHEFPKDPWGRPFRWFGETSAIRSAGPDGKEDFDEKAPDYDDEYFRLDLE